MSDFWDSGLFYNDVIKKEGDVFMKFYKLEKIEFNLSTKWESFNNLFVFIGKRGISKEGGTLNFQLGTEKFSGKK